MSNETKTMKSLRDRAREFSVSLPFMEGREKGETKDLIGTINTINEYGFLPNEKGGQFAVFTVKERPQHFFFGGMVITDQLAQLEAEGYHEAINDEGLPMLMTEKKSKNGMKYTNVEFFPEN